MYSAEMSGHADRNMRYNFFDFAGGAWNFIDPANFMNSGVNAFTARSGFGNLDVDPVTGVAYISCHQADGPCVGRDVAPGAGLFGECPGAPAVTGLGPSMSLTSSERVHVALTDDSLFQLCYSRIDPWCTWSTPVPLVPPSPEPGFAGYICRASKTSQKVLVTWVHDSLSGPAQGWYRQSTNDGMTWDTAVQVPYPPAFTPGSETTASFYVAGFCPFLDHADDLHIVAVIMPMIGGIGYAVPVGIWHWFQPTGIWSRIHRASAETLAAGVGYNALYAGRPTLCEGDPGELVCIWEEFDSLNPEPTTSLLRAEIRAARSLDNGGTWGGAVTLTEPSTGSMRFPAVAPRMWGDTVWIRYELDECAGFGIAPYAQGPITNNPIIVQRFVPWWFSIAEDRTCDPRVLSCVALPNPFAGATTLCYELPKSGCVRLSVSDAAGRTVRVLVDGVAQPGRHSVCWDGRGEHGMALRSGVYFCNLETGGKRLTRKVVLLP